MRSPGRRRPPRREIDVNPLVDLERIAAEATYVGSAEHKSYPSPAGPPRLRIDATKCDPQLHGDFNLLTAWLRLAIRRGCVGAPWEGDYPRWVWGRQNGTWYEARQVVPGRGQYKGYALLEEEAPKNAGSYTQ